MTEIERYKHPDQWKHFGRCEVCRRQPYCKKQCTANRQFAAIALKEFLRKTMLGRMKAAVHEAVQDASGEEVYEP